MKNLVIVESPAKAKTIEKYLGEGYTVKSSYGHIRDLAKKNLGIDIENGFEPVYEIDVAKKKLVAELQSAAKKADKVYLASDEDREGESIAWHLFVVLGLDPAKTQRIVFHEITPNAIKNAIANPRQIDLDLVNAQQARRVLDRIVGFEISPLLWRKVKPALSAGRVQSAAVRLIVEREREIQKFKPSSAFKVAGHFLYDDNKRNRLITAELNRRLNEKEVMELLEASKGHEFKVSDVQKKPGKKSPAPPFTTSTLQQEAGRRFGFSVSQTMLIAQRLYENGYITYMRTDSTNLSVDAIKAIKELVTDQFGENYFKERHYATKTRGAQEAHEAIRPTFYNTEKLKGNTVDNKLYTLIRKRAMASQMADATLEKTTITLPTPYKDTRFVATGEVVKFDGFLRLYTEVVDEDEDHNETATLPPIEVGRALETESIEATERFSTHPPRYSEASLVKKMEELGIGRPSTYAPTISTIQQRGYVEKGDREGDTRQIVVIALKDSSIIKQKEQERYGSEKAKLSPTDIGSVVNDYLVDKFDTVINYGFTANIEEKFDDIAQGELVWNQMIDNFYHPFHDIVAQASNERSTARVGERQLGVDPASGKPVSVRIGRYGVMAQIGTASDEEKPRFASLKPGQSLESITLEEALQLFAPPKSYGEYEGEPITFGSGRFGPYLKHKGLYYSISKTIEIESIDNAKAIEIIEAKREANANRQIKLFEEDPEIQVLRGRFGPYISYKKSNYKIAKDIDPATLTLEQCREIINAQPAGKKTTRRTTGTKAKK